MHISGVIVYCRSENLPQVQQTLREKNGVEVHATDPRGKLVVTVEHHDESAMIATVNGFSDHHDILATSIIYYQSDAA